MFRHVIVMSYKCSVMSTEVAPFLRISQMKHVDRKESLKSKMIILAVVTYMFSTGQLLLANLWGVLGKSGKE